MINTFVISEKMKAYLQYEWHNHPGGPAGHRDRWRDEYGIEYVYENDRCIYYVSDEKKFTWFLLTLK